MTVLDVTAPHWFWYLLAVLVILLIIVVFVRLIRL